MPYHFGAFVLDEARQELWRAEHPVPLEPQVWRVLCYLLTHHERVVRKDELCEQCWPGTLVSEAALLRCLSKVRQALGDNAQAPQYLKTLHGQGYRFIAPVTRTEGLPAASVPGVLPGPAAPPEALAPGREAAAARAVHALGGGARRQLTALGCILGDVWSLAARLPPEDLAQVFQTYYALCAEAARPFAGWLASTRGEEVLLYFGYPQAHEDAARRAVYAGLAIRQASQALYARLLDQYGVAVGVKLGIHTGLVVLTPAGDLQPTGPRAIGALSSVTMRLAEAAPLKTLVVSAAIWQQVQGYVVGQALGELALGGQATPVQGYRILQATGARTRLEATASQQLTPFVGRERERAVLHDAFTQVVAGQGQVVLLSGEPGIGKSRLLQVVLGTWPEAVASPWVCYCSPYHQHTPFFPVIDCLRRRLALADGASPTAWVPQVAQLLQQARLDGPRSIPIVAMLLGYALPADYTPSPQLTPLQLRQRTLETLAGLLGAPHQPTLLVMEDLHWADPSTRELLDLLVAQGPATPLLMLLTCRPTLACPWPGRSHVTTLSLPQLSPAQVAHMIRTLPGTEALAAPVIQQLVTATDGVPFFVEEMTRWAVMAAAPTGSAASTPGPEPTLPALPLTVQDALLARLEQLGPAKETAQLLAMLGRDGSWPLLLALTPLAEEHLRQALQQLVASDVVYQRGVGAQATYLFKHALLHEAAYQSLRRRTRQQAHQRIAEVLEQQFPQTQERQPELLAHHYTAAGLPEAAIPYWYQAGTRAQQHSAHAEAIAYVTRAVELLGTLPDTAARAHQELRLQRALGVSLLATRGFGAPEVAAAYQRAHDLCVHLGETTQLFPVLFGLLSVHHLRMEWPRVRELAERLMALGKQRQTPGDLLMGYWSLGNTLFWLGEFEAARTHLEHAMALYDPVAHRSYALLYGQDPLVGSQTYAAEALWALGYPEQGEAMMRAAITTARHLTHPFSLAWALVLGMIHHRRRREWQVMLELAEEVRALADEQGFKQYLAQGMTGQALARVMLGHHHDIEPIRQGIEARRRTGARSRTQELAFLAEVLRVTGQAPAGLPIVEQALAAAEETGERHCVSDLYRLKGLLLLEVSAATPQEAEQCFQTALRIARAQQAKSWELRAATSLAQLWQRQGRWEAARHLLAPVYGWFTEGLATYDVQEAGAVLAALRT